MTTNSANPERLHSYASDLRAEATTAHRSLSAARLALAAFNQACPSFPVSTSALATANACVDDAGALASETDITGVAFTTADQSSSTSGVRRADTSTLLTVISVMGGNESGLNGSFEDRSAVGFHRTGEIAISEGPIKVDAKGDVFVGGEVVKKAEWGVEDGAFEAEAWMTAFAGARAQAEVNGSIGFVDFDATFTAEAGATLTIGGDAHVGLDGIDVSAKGGAVLSATVGAEGEFDAGPVGGSGSCEAGVGVGIEGEADFKANLDEVSLTLGFTGFLGGGGGCTGGVSVSPKKSAVLIYESGTKIVGKGGEVVRRGGQVADAVFDTTTDLTFETLDAGRDLASDTFDTGRDAVGEVVDFAKNPLGKGTVTMSGFSQILR